MDLAPLRLLTGPRVLPHLCDSHQICKVGPVQRKCKGLSLCIYRFSNWKDATVSFSSHVTSLTHKRAVEVVITLPQTTGDAGELLSTAHTIEKCKNRQCMTTIAENIRFLARQGIPLRGDGKGETDTTFFSCLILEPLISLT